MKKHFHTKLTYSDVATIAKKTGIPMHTLWNACAVFHNPYNDDVFTFDYLVFRALNKITDTKTLKKAIS